MNTGGRDVVGRLLGPALAAMAMAVFGVTLSRYAYPGQSAGLIAQYSGLCPLMSPDKPLWGWLFGVVWSLPLGDAVVRVNALSAVFGALAVWLLYHLVATGVVQLVNPSDLTERRGVMLSRISAAVAALALCFSSPFWVVATRAHNATLDIALLLGGLALLGIYARTGRAVWLYTLAFVWGAGTVEYASFIIFAPLVVCAVLLLMWQKGQLRALPIMTTLACGLLGLSLYLVTAWHFYGTLGYELREYPSYFKVVWFMWRDQYGLITGSLPREGWLIIILTTGVPCLAGLGVARRGINDAPEWSDYLLHLVLSLVCGMVLLNVQVAPWAMLGHARLLVLPYVLTAALTGYLVAFWLRQALAWGEIPPSKWRKLVVRGSAIILLVALVAVVVAAPVRNFSSADTRPARIISRCVDLILGSAVDARTNDGSVWVVADGSLDEQLVIRAAQQGIDARVVNLRGAKSKSYRRYLASQFDTPRLQNLARVGMLPLLRELFGGDDSIRDDAIVFGAPDLWAYGGYVPVSDRLCFRGQPGVEASDLVAVLKRHESYWDTVPPQLVAVAARPDLADPVAAVATHLLRQSSMVANNLGVLLEDNGMTEKAFETYAQALLISSNNVSATLNMVRLVNSGYKTDRSAKILADFELLKQSGRANRNMLALSVLYGYVRDPQAFSGIARTWALTGQPSMAAQSYKKALDLVAPDQERSIKEGLAGLYLGQSRDEESEALFYELLAEDPDSKTALMGLARIAARKGKGAEARAHLVKARAAGAAEEAVAMERAVIAILESNDAQARTELEALVRGNENLIPAWRMLVDVLVRAQDWRELERAAERLRALRGGIGLAAEVQAVLALRNADLPRARRYYGEALSAQPNNLLLLRRVLRLELMAGALDSALGHARTILQLDTTNALANYVVGAARMAGGEVDLAEEVFRRSLEIERLPEALNDLAWLLLQKNEYAEAEALAREAVQLKPAMHQAWDTLGEILMRQGKLAEAEVALEKVLALTPDSPGALLHMAQLQAAKGDKPHAREILHMIADRADRLSSEAKAEYDALLRSLGDG
jgi:tetratricopeptide (TPR) repeat protein